MTERRVTELQPRPWTADEFIDKFGVPDTINVPRKVVNGRGSGVLEFRVGGHTILYRQRLSSAYVEPMEELLGIAMNHARGTPNYASLHRNRANFEVTRRYWTA